MPYRNDRDALRDRIEWLESELDRARTARDRVPALKRELADARERLARSGGARADRTRTGLRRAIVLTAIGGAVAMAGLWFFGEGPAPANAPPDPPRGAPLAEVVLDLPAGWEKTSEDGWTHLTSLDRKARMMLIATQPRSAVPERYRATNTLCEGQLRSKPEEHREIGPDHLPAYYYEGICDAGEATIVSVDVLFGHPEPYDPLRGPSTAHIRDVDRLVVVYALAKDCPEARRQEAAAVIASIRRKPGT
jgi:hypothetical protein